MVWSAPMTAVANSVFTAAQFNTFVRDNLNETAPAKASAAGSHFVASGVNAIAERRTTGGADLDSGTTTSTSYGDLDNPAAPGPSVTVDTGPMAIVIVHGQMSNNGTGSARLSYTVSGVSSQAAADNQGAGIAASAGTLLMSSAVILHSGGTALTPGSNTFDMKYRVSSGTGTFQSRRIIVFPL